MHENWRECLFVLPDDRIDYLSRHDDAMERNYERERLEVKQHGVDDGCL